MRGGIDTDTFLSVSGARKCRFGRNAIFSMKEIIFLTSYKENPLSPEGRIFQILWQALIKRNEKYEDPKL